jgi:hypothetical protein
MSIRVLLSIIAGLCFAYIGTKSYLYPYGVRSAALPCFVLELRLFAGEHDGWFPGQNTTNSFAALSELYAFEPGAADLLAGLTGDVKTLKRALKQGRAMDSSLTSWVYWPGYREDDDENLALVWERRSGVTFDGRRLPGRAVGFVTGHWRQIPDEEWAAFEDSQMKLRAETLRRRIATPQPPVEGGP